MKYGLPADFGVEGPRYFDRAKVAWFKSYLSNWKHCIEINYVESTKQVVRKYTSDLKEIKHGVPQRSVLSPILFLLYISDLPINIQGAKTILFANDTNIQIKAVYEDTLNQKIELCSSYKFGFI